MNCFLAQGGVQLSSNFTPLEVKSKNIFRLTLPVRALSTSVSLPKSSGIWSSSVSDTGSIFCRLVLVVSPLEVMEKQEVSYVKKMPGMPNMFVTVLQFRRLFTHPMSCSCDRSLENGMKSTMLRRALDLLEPAMGKAQLFCFLNCDYSFLDISVLLTAHSNTWQRQKWPEHCLYLFCNFFLTSLYGTLFSLRVGKGVDEVSKGAVAAEQLLVGAALCDFSIYQHEDMVSLRQEAHPVGHQDAGL